MNVEQRPTKDPIPQFATREEEAEFWDTHDFADYWDELNPVKIEGNPNLSSLFQIPLDAETITQICQYANETGVDAGTLVRGWILERLRDAGTLTPG